LTDTIINLETVNPIEFFGVNNGKLDILKKKFPLLKILSRGTQLKLSGAPEQVENAREKIDLIVQYLERNGHMSENYFEQILGGDDADAIDHFIERNPNDILGFWSQWKECSRTNRPTKKNWFSKQKKMTLYLRLVPPVRVKHTPRLHLQYGH
jgi:phosphate starvation-inducible PhoH-like protein